MKAKRLLAVLLALCLLISAMPMGFMFSASAASSVLDPDRITAHDNLRELVINADSNVGVGSKLFDGTFDPKLEGNWPGTSVTVTWETSEPTTVTAYTMATQDDGAWPNRQPTAWTLYGSADGETYVALDSVSDYKVYNENNVYYDDDFLIENPAEYTYYKIEYTACAGNGYFQVGELILSGCDTAPMLAVIGKIDAIPESTDDGFAAAVSEARTAYDALEAGKANVTNIDKLIGAEKLLAVADADNPEDAAAAVDAINAIGTVNYKSLPAIEAAEAAWAKLSDADKEMLASYGETLAAARPAYEAVFDRDSFTWKVTEERPVKAADKNKMNDWLADCSDDVWNASREDLADSVWYAFTKGRNVGFINGTTSGKYDTWMTDNFMWYLRLSGSEDNYNNQDFQNNSTIAVNPFPGMGFVVDTTFAQTYWFERSLAIGEPFEWDGRIYQVMWNGYRSYDASVIPSSSGDVENSGRQNHDNLNADERSSDMETGKYIFRYAYAKYSSENRWEGLTYGLPQSQYANAVGDETRIQEFDGPQGKAYLITTLPMIEAAPTDMAAENYAEEMDKAYVAVTGKLAEVMASEENLYDKLGDFVSASETEIVFDGGKITADGFVPDPAIADAAAAVDAIIEKLGEIASLDQKADVEAARAAYNELNAASKAYVTKLETLEAAEAAIQALEDAAAAKSVADMINALGEITSLDQKADVEAARAAYNKLSAAAKAMIDSEVMDKLYDAEDAIIEIEDTAAAAAVDALIETIGEVTSLDQLESVEAARTAYDQLSAGAKALVKNLSVLETAEEAIDKLINPSVKGDVDGNGVVNVSDIMTLKNLIMNSSWTPEQLKAGDMNNDGTLTVGDMLSIKSIIMAG